MDTTANPREARGRELAKTARIASVGRVWTVASQTTQSSYVVSLHKRSCTCPDHEIRGVKCKHIFAVEWFTKREIDREGAETLTKGVRVTYAQNWPAYNRAQQEEKARVEELLRGLCAGIVMPSQTGKRGRPRLPLADVTFSAVMKVYSTFSGRRATTDIRECATKGSSMRRRITTRSSATSKART
jgi:hypothetical protein